MLGKIAALASKKRSKSSVDSLALDVSTYLYLCGPSSAAVLLVSLELGQVITLITLTQVYSN